MRKLLSILAGLLLLLGCNKKPTEPQITSEFTNGFFALNEGLFQQNNSSLSFYSLSSQQQNHSVFSTINGRGLGDTANDMIAFSHQGRLYYAIVVNVSSQLEIIDGLTLKSVSQIGLFDSGIGRQPRSVKAHNGFLYITSFDGTVSVIDLDTFEEITTISVGSNPESSLIFQNKLYVVNTGGLNFPHYDSTISVINLSNHSVTNTFTAGINGSSLINDSEGEGYMISRGNYNDIKPQLVRLDLSNLTVLNRYDINPITLAYDSDLIYYYDDMADAIFTFDTQTEEKDAAALIDCSNFENVYSITINHEQQLIYVSDANGYVNSSIIRIYNLQGAFQREIISGLNTNSIVFSP